MAQERFLASAELTLKRADASHIAFIMHTERIAGYESLVGRWDEAQHRAALVDHRHAYFVACDRSDLVGFAIVRDWASLERVTAIKRIAVDRPDRRYGRALLAGVVDAIFHETEAHRGWLGVFPENVRARRAYAAVGFRPEGIARESAYFGGVYRDELIMAILRLEWRYEWSLSR